MLIARGPAGAALRARRDVRARGRDLPAQHGPSPPPAAGRTCLGTGLVVLDVIYPAGATGLRCLAGGSCCNVLAALAWLGWRSIPVARLGDDPDAGRIVRDMSRFGVDSSHVGRDPAVATPRIIERLLVGTEPRHEFYFRCRHGRRLPRWRPPGAAARSAALGAVPAPDVFYFDRATPGALDMAGRCRRAGALVVFEPPGRPGGAAFRRGARLADVVKVSAGPGGVASFGPWADAPEAGQLRIATRSEEGLEYEARHAGGRAAAGSMPAVQAGGVVDAAGAGDMLTAGFLHALPASGAARARGPAGMPRAPLERALRFGQSLSAINCRYAGARGAMYANTAEAAASAAEAAASAGRVDPGRLGAARYAGSHVQGGRCGAYACGAEAA